jgi:glycerol kinase
MTKHIGAIDQGTTSTRLILFDDLGRIVSIAQKKAFFTTKSLVGRLTYLPGRRNT